MNNSIREMAERWIRELEESHGGQPFVPPSLREVDVEGLYRTNYCAYEPLAQGYGYIKGNIEILGKPSELHQGHWMVWWDGTGLFIYRGWAAEHYPMRGGVSRNTCAVRFFAFGCKHDMERTRNLGRCWNEYQCKHCGLIEQVDSSD